MNIFKVSIITLCLGLLLVGWASQVNAQATFLQDNITQQQQVAQGAGYADVNPSNPRAGLANAVVRVISILLGLLGTIVVLIIIYAGWLWMTAGGNQDRVDKSRKWLINGVIGLLLILSAYSISRYTAHYLIQATRSNVDPTSVM